MLDRITGSGIDDQLESIRQADRTQQTESILSAAKADGASGGAGLIADTPDISPEAKARLSRENAVKPYVQQLLADNGSPLDTARVERFKQMLANGSIGDYLKDAIPRSVEGLLASPEGQALKANLR